MWPPEHKGTGRGSSRDRRPAEHPRSLLPRRRGKGRGERRGVEGVQEGRDGLSQEMVRFRVQWLGGGEYLTVHIPNVQEFLYIPDNYLQLRLVGIIFVFLWDNLCEFILLFAIGIYSVLLFSVPSDISLLKYAQAIMGWVCIMPRQIQFKTNRYEMYEFFIRKRRSRLIFALRDAKGRTSLRVECSRIWKVSN